MSKISWCRYYQKNKEKLQKRHVLKKKKKNRKNMVPNNRKISLKMKNKGWMSIRKIILLCIKN